MDDDKQGKKKGRKICCLKLILERSIIRERPNISMAIPRADAGTFKLEKFGNSATVWAIMGDRERFPRVVIEISFCHMI
jgi:hypothetical protein